jgi:mono/diheme cytochrome c family protein
MKSISIRQRIWFIGAFAVLIVGAVGAWVMLPPRALSFAGGNTVTLSAYRGASPSGVPAELRSADLVTRGKYLSEAADCEVCHTTEGGKPFAGGRAFPTPFGVLYSPNITADRETGIGTWTDEDFITAVHKGIAKGGQRLYPAFPYESYTLLEDDDVRAIRAYIFSLPVARAPAPPNGMKFPYNQRWLMGIWSAFYNPDQRFQPLQNRSSEWNRGAYLVEGLGHCGDCHTPRNIAQALDNRRKFEGAVADGWRAYNITSDKVSGVGEWSDAELIEYLHAGHAVGRGSVGGPMAEVVDASLRNLLPADIRAMVAYLRSIPAIRTRDLAAPKVSPASDMPKRIDAGADPRGEQIFAGNCASCHGWSGVSLLTSDATLTGDRAVNDASAVNVAQMILSGANRRTPGGVLFMPAFGSAYSDTEIAAVANYVTGRFGATPSHLTARDIAKFRRLSSQ